MIVYEISRITSGTLRGAFCARLDKKKSEEIPEDLQEIILSANIREFVQRLDEHFYLYKDRCGLIEPSLKTVNLEARGLIRSYDGLNFHVPLTERQQKKFWRCWRRRYLQGRKNDHSEVK